MVVVYPLGVPIFCTLALHRSRNKRRGSGREDATHVKYFKDLWKPYRLQVYHYEVVECLRRVTLTRIIAFVYPDSAGQVATTFLMALHLFATLMILDP